MTTQPSSASLFVKMALSSWNSHNDRVDKLIKSLPEEVIMRDTAPGRNSGIYLFGHLIAVSDGLFPLLGFGPRLYPFLDKIFLESPDKSNEKMPSLDTLKQYWQDVNIKLAAHIDSLPAEEWFTKHNSVSAEDFAKEPHRNKLNIILNRTAHTSYHLGQLIYLANKNE